MPFPFEVIRSRQVSSYLNSASIGLVPTVSYNAWEHYGRMLATQGPLCYQELLEVQEKARNNLARLMNVTSEDVGFVPSTSHGMDLFAQMGLGQDRGTILCPAEEFPSTILPWEGRGYQCLRIPATDGQYPIENFRRAMSDEIFAIVLSKAQYATGCQTSLAPLSELAHKYGALLIVNVTQAIGLQPLDLIADGVDLAAGTGHKWLLSGFGNGFAYFSSAMRDRFDTPGQGWLSVEEPMLMKTKGYRKLESAAAVEYGTMGILPRVVLLESSNLLLNAGISKVFSHAKKLAALIRKGAAERNIPISGPISPENQGATVNLTVTNADEIAQKLTHRGVIISTRAGIRLSPHAFNTERDIQFFWRIWDEVA